MGIFFTKRKSEKRILIHPLREAGPNLGKQNKQTNK